VLWGGGQVCSRCLEFMCNSCLRCGLDELVGLAVCTGLGSPRACRCCGTKEWSIEIVHSGNPSCVEGGDVEQVCSNLETNPSCLRLLTLSISLFISCMLIIVFIFTFLIFIVLNWYTCLGLFANTCIQLREPTRHINPYQGESRGVSPEPFTGNSATLLCYTWCLVYKVLLGHNSF